MKGTLDLTVTPALQPRMLAAMHGSTFVGDGAAALIASCDVIREVSGVTSPAD